MIFCTTAFFGGRGEGIDVPLYHLPRFDAIDLNGFYRILSVAKLLLAKFKLNNLERFLKELK